MAKQRTWPRRGYPLVPATYRLIWYGEPLPKAVLDRAGLSPGTCVHDLDADVWDSIEDFEDIRSLAHHLTLMVYARIYNGADDEAASAQVLAGKWNPVVDPTHLPFASRTRNVLNRQGLLADTSWLASVSGGEFLRLPHAGAATLLDFAGVAEAHGAAAAPSPAARRRFAKLEVELDALREKFPIDSMDATDPRFAPFRLAGASIAVGLTAALHQTKKSRESSKLLRSVGDLLQRITDETLEEGLARLLDPSAPERHRDALAHRLGWDGQGGCTLQEAGEMSGISRERMRQLQSRVNATLSKVTFFPALEEAIDLLDGAAETLESDAAGLLEEAGLAKKPFLPAGVVSAADMLRLPLQFVVGAGGRSVRLPGDEQIATLQAALRTLSDVNHVASVFELHDRVCEVAGEELPIEATSSFVDTYERTAWLDRDHIWFWVRQQEGRNRYMNYARKILSVTNPISFERLREGVHRHYRTQNTALPREVLEGLLRASGFEVADDRVTAPALDPADVLEGIELMMVDFLRAAGNVSGHTELRGAYADAGFSRHSFQVYLSYSPILERVARGTYALRGSEIDPNLVSQALRQPSPGPALQGGGWTSDGAVWLGYRVTASLLDSGVITVPRRIYNIVGEGRFKLYASDGTRVGELVVAATGNGWGLTPFMGRRGVDIDDVLVVTIDTDIEAAMIQAGTGDLLLEYQEGEGLGPWQYLKDTTAFDDDEID